MKDQEFIISKSSLLHIIGYGIAGLRLANKLVSESKQAALSAIPLTERMLKEAEAMSAVIESGGFITILNNCPDSEQSVPEERIEPTPLPEIETGLDWSQSTEESKSRVPLIQMLGRGVRAGRASRPAGILPEGDSGQGTILEHMKPEQQRIAIAKACGWKIKRIVPDAGYTRWTFNDPTNRLSIRDAYETDDGIEWPDCIPNYLSDLNAMHEAEKVLDNEKNIIPAVKGHETQMDRYRWWLEQIVEPTVAEDDIWQAIIQATASQRAEAFLRTLNLWTD